MEKENFPMLHKHMRIKCEKGGLRVGWKFYRNKLLEILLSLCSKALFDTMIVAIF